MNYAEKTFEGKREYHLDKQELRVEGKEFLFSDYQTTVQLSELNPDFERIRIRIGSFYAGIGTCLLFFIAASVLSELFKVDALSRPISMLYSLSLCGALMALVTFRKIEYVRVRSKYGIPIIAIAKAGKRKDEFEHFIGCLRNNIENQGKT